MNEKEKQNMLCKNCNHKINKNDIYCENCGASINYSDLSNEKKDGVNIKTNEKNHKNNMFWYITGGVLLFLLGAAGMFLCIDYFYEFDNNYENDGGLLKQVSITDNGIAESVAKVYDSVVVVENYKKDTLISTGTGFVYNKDKKYGYILTNNHVIDNATDVYVTFTNGKREKVSIVGTDAYSDVALLKVSVDSIISVAEIGDSEKLRLGDTTFAIGAPLDYQVYSWSVTRGIISGKERLVEVSLSNSNTGDYVMEVLQTDTAINSGNSGGPLCNANGEVIGITNMKLASSSVEGMGFAIPIEKAIEYAQIFMNGKTITRPYLGISMYDLASMKNSFFFYNINTKLSNGVYINSVEKGSCADIAGLQSGDIITKIDDVEIKSSAYLRYVLYQHKVGDKVKVTYYRNDKENTVSITLKGNSNSI